MVKKFVDKNSYTLGFSVAMVVMVGAVLAFATIKLKPFQDENKTREKIQNILNSVGVKVSMEEASKAYQTYIKQALVLNAKGQILEGEKAFDIDITTEIKKVPKDQKMPLYIAEKDQDRYYITPLYGTGLWGPVWGYVSLDQEFKIVGIILDHKSETPGLGAEITQDFFMESFNGERIFDTSGNYQGVRIVKGTSDPGNTNKEDNQVDGISGATKTGDGVSEMLVRGLRFYLPYLQTVRNKL
ncbi:MAG: NADH:ubiquinone reductase (Na(+)-transporting) subunit C [Flavobacteriales bacterium AspAUS03]